DLGDFRRLAVELCEDLAATGVRYAEVVFSPGNHARRFADDWYGPIEAVLDGLAAGEARSGVTVQLCPDIVRDNGLDDAERTVEGARRYAGRSVLCLNVTARTVEVACRYAGRGVVALNCAGSERTDVSPFAPLFRRAADAGLRSVPHAGEWAGPENVRATIRYLRPDRIGHGVRAAEDPVLVLELAERRLPLELCPISNVATGASPDLASHPFPLLRNAGVVVTLNSDDPAMFGAWLTEVFEMARDTWDLDDAALADLARAGVDASFADASRKAALRRDIDDWLAAAAPAATP